MVPPHEPLLLAQDLAIAGALGVFLGLAFEDTYKREHRLAPGGIRTFPVLALTGALLYLAEPQNALAFIAGLLAVALWLFGFIRADAEPRPVGGMIIPAANMLAYSIGPIALTQPPWVIIGVTVAAAMLVGGRERIHALARRVPRDEVLTAGKFLILVGLILPLVPDTPLVEGLAPLTPYRIWLALVAVSGLSYAGYLLQRMLPNLGGGLLPAVVGGLYSSTATTVVLARRQKEVGAPRPELAAGIVVATAIMYLRLGIICALFNLTVAARLAPALAALLAIAGVLTWLQWRRAADHGAAERVALPAENPLQLSAALGFSLLFTATAVLSSLADREFGAAGVFALALLVGLADIDSFALSIAQGGLPALGPGVAAGALLLAASSNNAAKAVYALAFGGRPARGPALALALLAALGLAGAGVLAR